MPDLRRPFAGTAAEVVVNAATGRPQPGRDANGLVAVEGYAWTDVQGGAAVPDLVDAAGQPFDTGSLVPDEYGRIPRFYGPPDGTASLWLDFGGGERILVLATDLPERISTLEAAAGTTSDSLTLDTVLTARGPVINLTHPDYGAVGDGVADDSAAFQAAFTVAAAYGATVYTPPGTYPVSATLHGYQNLDWCIARGAVIKRAANVTLFVNGDPDQNAPGFTGQGNIRVHGGGTIDMQGSVLSGSNNCMSFGHAENITVEDITILDEPSFHAIELNAVKTGRVRNVKFKGWLDKSPTGANWYKEAIQVDIAKGTSYFPSFGPYDDTCSEDIEVTGCYFGPNPDNPATHSYPTAIGSHSATINKRYKGIRFTGNYGEDLSAWITSGYAWSGSLIADNEFWRTAAGFRVESVKTSDRDDTIDEIDVQTGASQAERGVTIVNNRLFDLTGLPTGHGLPGDAIRVLGESTGKISGVVILGNTIEGGTGGLRGIRVKYGDRVVIDDNTVTGLSGYGIWSEHCTNITVGAGNVLDTIANHGVYVTDTTNFRVGPLAVTSPTLEGIHLERSGDGRVFGAAVKLAGSHGINIFDTCYDITIEDNVVKGASRTTNATSSAFRMSSSCQRIRFKRNAATKNVTSAGALSGNQYLYAFSSTNTCTLVEFEGNSWQDGTAGAGTAKNNAATVAYDAGTDRIYA